MAQDSDQEKTEEATPQRREDFRKQGQVAQTRELSSALALFGLSLLIWFMGRIFVEQFFEIYNFLYRAQWLATVKTGDIMPALVYAFKKIIYLSLPAYVILFTLGVMSTVVQIGFMFSEEAMKPNINKINPLEGLKRLFSLKAIVEGLKALSKFSLVAVVIYMVLKGEFETIPKLMFGEPAQVFKYIGTLIFKSMLAIGGLMSIVAGLDYMFQRFDMEKQMRMTKQEVKEEVKSREGDPLIKARIRKIQKEMANKRMMEEVPKADVIITNPTHLAIALKYDPTKFAAPVILAKGADHMAKKIRELAKEHEVPIVENKPLARTIYKTLEIGQTIPRELFQAVAEVLAYVFKLKRKRSV
ncbi:MAG: flagellar biosynthesis protein FlhB [Bdellovibrionales bacterium]|nr:flagellar biosynthesis protein FlhB [Bdellovibrionales bacterium]NQZ19749.1 flagellar biosynthesis protein FlhB [Bdellovibrionales bacterium]